VEQGLATKKIMLDQKLFIKLLGSKFLGFEKKEKYNKKMQCILRDKLKIFGWMVDECTNHTLHG
jgi:hypothetical protein